MEYNMQNNTISNNAWKIVESLSVKAIQLVVQLYMTRKLLPNDVGIMSLGLVIVNFAEIFLSSGLYSSIVQKKEPKVDDYSTAVTVTLSFGFVFYIVAFILSGRIAAYYEIPLLKTVIRILLLVVPMYAVISIVNAYAAKHFLFRKMFYCNLLASIFSGMAGIVYVNISANVWALVLQNMIYNILLLLFLILFIKPKIIGHVSKKRLRPLLKIGIGTLSSSMIAFVSDNAYSAIIGKKMDVNQLGYYNKAGQISSTLPNAFNTSIASVMLPTFSQYQDDDIILKEKCRNAVRFYNYIYFPILFGMTACAGNFVMAVLTDTWAPIIRVLQLLCISYLFIPFLQITSQAYLAIGQVGVRIKLEILKMFLVIVGLFLSLPFGIEAVACSRIAVFLIICFAAAFISKKLINYKIREQLIDTIKPMMLSIIMFCIVHSLNLLNCSAILKLLFQVIIGASAYIVMMYVFRIPEYKEILKMVKRK